MKKKRKGSNLKAIFQFDFEDGELLSFIWEDDEKPPPLIKPKIKKKRDVDKEGN